MKKRAEFGFTVGLILVLVSTFVTIALVNKAQDKSAYDKEMCMHSVAFNSRGRLPVVENQMFTINCPTRYVYFYTDRWEEEVTYNQKQNLQKEDIDCGRLDTEENKQCYLEEMNKKIANLIFDCWDQFAAGQVLVFSKYDTGRQCKVCSEIVFTQELKDFFQNYIITDEYSLQEYMISNSPLKKSAGKEEERKISYYQFALDELDAFRMPYYDIDIDKDYAVVFRALNEHAVVAVAKEAWNKIKLTVFNEASGKEVDFINTIHFIPKSEVFEKCDSLE
jgi:hypothetical protein